MVVFRIKYSSGHVRIMNLNNQFDVGRGGGRRQSSSIVNLSFWNSDSCLN